MSDTGINRLGFGTSGLMGAAFTDRGRIDLLNYAFSKGIVHYDTAPLYGQGEAEKVLGKFIRDKRSEVTISTKFGLPPQRIPFYLTPLRPLGRYVNRNLTHLKPLIRTAVDYLNRSNQTQSEDQDNGFEANTMDLGSVLREQSSFRPETIEQELNSSLKKLGVEKVDFYLFHECSANEVNGELIELLNRFVSAGKVGTYGIATSLSKTHQILSLDSSFNGVIQTSADALGFDALHNGHSQLFLHSLFRGTMFQELVRLSQIAPAKVMTLMQELNIQNVAHNPAISICLNLAVQHPSVSKSVFSTSNRVHLDQVVESLDPRFDFNKTHLIQDAVTAI